MLHAFTLLLTICQQLFLMFCMTLFHEAIIISRMSFYNVFFFNQKDILREIIMKIDHLRLLH